MKRLMLAVELALKVIGYKEPMVTRLEVEHDSHGRRTITIEVVTR